MQKEDLIAISNRLINRVPKEFKRSLSKKIEWSERLIGVKGARGTGKTTMLLQYLSTQIKEVDCLYVSLDELYFTDNTLLDFGASFYEKGGKILVLDEVHKYAGWSREIKNLHDRYLDLQIIFAGSSIMDITRQEGDLSRRAIIYELVGLSYREFLAYQYQINFDIISLDEIIDAKFRYLDYFNDDFKPLEHFREYLEYGYYPFSQSSRVTYPNRLRQLTRTIVEVDMAEIKEFDIRQAKKLLQLLYIIAQQVPFKPNITRLASKTNIHRNSMNNYLYFLQEARMISLLYPRSFSVAALQKPEKIFLDNTNLVYALSQGNINDGAIREMFFHNQVSALHTIHQSSVADFIVDDKFTFEVGGKRKTSGQIKDVAHAWVVKDDLAYPAGQSLPLWIFGFLY